MCDEVHVEPEYKGPHHLAEDVSLALDRLANILEVERLDCGTHSTLISTNYQNEVFLQAATVYLVAAISQSITTNLAIRRALLFDEEDLVRSLHSDVAKVIREGNDDERFNRMTRDPWMWEGISHLLLHASRRTPAFHPPGQILATTGVKLDVHDHGLDIIAIYIDEHLGITTGECKAYLGRPTDAIRDAANKLREVDRHERDGEIRAALNRMVDSLTPEQQAGVARAFWHESRSHFPFVCCDADHALDWNSDRQCLGDLNVLVPRKFLFPLPIAEARRVFNSVANRMRTYTLANTPTDV